MKCLQCQSERLVHKARTVDYIDMTIKQPLKLELDSNPDAWVFKGTRVPVRALFENLEDGATINEFLEWFPGVTLRQVEAVLEHAADSLVVEPA